MDARLQRRIQRYGWDLAAVDYESLWQAQLAEAQDALLALASPAVGERVLDIACGTGLVSFEAARAVGPSGHVLGIDLSEQDGGCRRTAGKGPEVIELQLFTHGRRELGPAGRQLRRRSCAPLGSCTCPIPNRPCGRCAGYCVRAVAYLSPYGVNARTAVGQRSFPIVDARGGQRGMSVVLSSRAAGHSRAPVRRCEV